MAISVVLYILIQVKKPQKMAFMDLISPNKLEMDKAHLLLTGLRFGKENYFMKKEIIRGAAVRQSCAGCTGAAYECNGWPKIFG